MHVAINPADEHEVSAAQAAGRPAYLRCLPFGVWVRADKYSEAPFCDKLLQITTNIDREAATHLIFIEPQTSKPFEFRKHKSYSNRISYLPWQSAHNYGLPGPHDEPRSDR